MAKFGRVLLSVVHIFNHVASTRARHILRYLCGFKECFEAIAVLVDFFLDSLQDVWVRDVLMGCVEVIESDILYSLNKVDRARDQGGCCCLEQSKKEWTKGKKNKTADTSTTETDPICHWKDNKQEFKFYLLVVPRDLDSLLLAEQTTTTRFVGRYDLRVSREGAWLSAFTSACEKQKICCLCWFICGLEMIFACGVAELSEIKQQIPTLSTVPNYC